MTELLRWLTEMPPEFSGDPDAAGPAGVCVRAVVGDLFETLTGELPDAELLASFAAQSRQKGELNRLRWVLAACHLLWHPQWRRQLQSQAPRLRKLFLQDLSTLAATADAEQLATEQERREELIRKSLLALGYHPAEETPQEALERLEQVDSVVRQQLLADYEKRRQRLAREEAVRRQAALEAASKPGRE